MNSAALWRKVKQLDGKYVTMVRGAKIHVYKVTDEKVFYDPVNGQSPGSHWAARSVIVQLSGEILSGKHRRPDTPSSIEGLCEELGKGTIHMKRPGQIVLFHFPQTDFARSGLKAA